MRQAVDFGIVVPLQVERDAVLAYLKGHTRVTDDGVASRTYYRCAIPLAKGGHYEIAVVMLPQMGNVQAALATADLVNLFRPRYVIVLGIAGAIPVDSMALGDIVIADQIFYYEEQKIEASNVEFRPRVVPVNPELYDRALHFVPAFWPSSIKVSAPMPNTKPTIHFGPVASGDKVVKTPEFSSKLLQLHPKLLAVEMESGGAAAAALSAVARVGFLSIRSICDFANKDKNDLWHEFAAHSAAAFLHEFLVSCPVITSQSTAPDHTERVHDRAALLNSITQRLDLEEFRTLCFLLGVDFDDLGGEGKVGKARELILKLERKGTLDAIQGVLKTF
jgi:nucleoside phosphorylase